MKTNSTLRAEVFIVWYVHASHIDEREMENGRCYMTVPNRTAYVQAALPQRPDVCHLSLDLKTTVPEELVCLTCLTDMK